MEHILTLHTVTGVSGDEHMEGGTTRDGSAAQRLQLNSKWILNKMVQIYK